jgi:Ca-activated chloride channel family protein
MANRIIWRGLFAAAVVLPLVVCFRPQTQAAAQGDNAKAAESFPGESKLTQSVALQSSQHAPAPPLPPSFPQQGSSIIRRDVNLVLLHVAVLDGAGDVVGGLPESSFRVLEDKVEQRISLFRNNDVPITVGILVDNSGSMRLKRPGVNAAALTFVKTSNPQDQVFIVNFNDEFYLDMDKDFSSDPKDLQEALDRIDSRGETALYDAIVGSLDHLKKGTRDKKVLLVITDGEDNTSRETLEYTVRAAQESNAVIYAIGLFSDDPGPEKRHGKKALEEITKATGGEAYFPEGVDQVESICTRIAHDIRNQYTIAYYPSNTARDGTFRTVKVEVSPPHGVGHVTVRTKPGYFAPSATSAN